MVTAARKSKKQDVEVSFSPKFNTNYEFYVPTSFFGKKWAEQKFGTKYPLHFLIGKVGKSKLNSKKRVEYQVYFKYDRKTYLLDEDIVTSFLPKNSEVQLDKIGGGYVVFSDCESVKISHGGKGMCDSFFRFSPRRLTYFL